MAHDQGAAVHRLSLTFAGVATAIRLAAAPAQATFPGKNGVLVFERPVGRQADLFTVTPDGGAVHRLTRTKAWEEKPEWSADGRRLAFARSKPSGAPTEIATTDASGGDLRALTSFGSTSSAPTWSPDGRIAYFTLRDFPASGDGLPPAELYSMTQDGGDQQRLTNDKQIQTDAEWSPDGSTIAYSQWRAVSGQPGVFDIGLSLMNRDGTNRRALLAASARRDVLTQSWSPDGKRIVVEIASAQPSGRARGSRQSDIAVVNADGTGLRHLTRTAALEAEPVWSPDGTRIAFVSDRHVKRGRRLDRNGPAFEIYTMRPDETGIKRITHNHVADMHPNWQPLP
jgi:Tol biopolymer transport system component